MQGRRSISTILASFVAAAAMSLTLGLTPAYATVSRDDGPVYTITRANGVEEVVTVDRLAVELRRNPGMKLGLQEPARATTNAVGRREGSWYVTFNVYFNRSETNRIAAGAAVVMLLPAGTPSVVRLAIAGASRLALAWAGTAVALNMCVGIKTPITVGPRIPVPIYHRSGYCR